MYVEPTLGSFTGMSGSSGQGRSHASTVVTTIGVISGLLAILAFFGYTRLAGEERAIFPGPGVSPSDETEGGSTGGGSTGGPSTSASVVRWQGQFLLRQVSGIELDSRPAIAATGPAGNLDEGDLFYDNSEALEAYS